MTFMNIQEHIDKKLRLAFSCEYLAIENESYRHRVPKDAETHFKVIIVSEDFYDVALVMRHRRVYAALEEVMKNIHALALHTLTPREWSDKTCGFESPECVHKNVDRK